MCDEVYYPEELKIALNLAEYVKTQMLMKRDLKSINRIVKIYFEQKRRIEQEDKLIIDFLFSYLDTHGKKASILFANLKNYKELNSIIKRIYNDYQDKFDFNVLNETLFKNSFELIKKDEKMKKYFYFTLVLLSLLVIVSSMFYFQKETIKKELFEQMQKNKAHHINLSKLEIEPDEKSIIKKKDEWNNAIESYNKLKISLFVIKFLAFFIDLFLCSLIFYCSTKKTIFMTFAFISQIGMSFIIIINCHLLPISILYTILFNITIVFNFSISFDEIKTKLVSIYLSIICSIKYFLFIEKDGHYIEYSILFILFAIEIILYILLSNNLNDGFIFSLCGELLIFLFEINGNDSLTILTNSGCITIILFLLVHFLDNITDITNSKIPLLLTILTTFEYCVFIFKKHEIQYYIFISIILLIEIAFLKLFNTKYDDNNLFICELLLMLLLIHINHSGLLIMNIIAISIIIYSMYNIMLDVKNKKFDYLKNKTNYNYPLLLFVALSTIAKYLFFAF